MARFISTTISTGQTVIDDNMEIKAVSLTAAAATAVAKIYGAGGEEIRISAAATTTNQLIAPGSRFYVFHIPGPVTLDLSGAGAWLRIDY